MNFIKQHINQYKLFNDLKSSIKAEEYQKNALKSDLEKLQGEVFELNARLDSVKWKIKRAEFILACEKKRHEFFYSIIETAEDTISKDNLFQQFKNYGFDMNKFRVRLEEEKYLLIKQLEELKQ